MINLIRWREQRVRNSKLIALFIISTSYMLIIVPAMIYLPRMQRHKEMLDSQVLRMGDHSQVMNESMQKQMVVINKLVWAKHHFIVMFMHKLADIPTDVVLVSLACHLTMCEFNVAGGQVQRLMHVFANSRLRDLKQGGCPLCYRAKIDVRLS